MRETPQSVSIVTRERMDQQELHSLRDVINQTTGVFVENNGAGIGGRSAWYSRGFVIERLQVDGLLLPSHFNA
ncbi:TonB-dependent receptor plug domain-containing protein [Thauera sp. SDU_THAU2]|uniref:TonB-dependent receptor plug domain-containing protein n=1 Tax=Thauera sp. SDU_THAU2 TaxID=3136633 RepID=UPI00311F0581